MTGINGEMMGTWKSKNVHGMLQAQIYIHYFARLMNRNKPKRCANNVFLCKV